MLENISVVNALLIGYLPGIVLSALIYFIAKRKAPMPLFRADIISFLLPLIVWFVMYKYNWTFAKSAHNHAIEAALLGWIWSLAFIARLIVPRYTHKLRFRLASINTGSIALIAAVALALFYR